MTAPDIVGSLSLNGSDGGKIARAVVCLEDTTEADAASIVLARTECRGERENPGRASFRLLVPDDLLVVGRQYSLSARAEVDCGHGKKRFGTVQSYPLGPSGPAVTDLELRNLD